MRCGNVGSVRRRSLSRSNRNLGSSQPKPSSTVANLCWREQAKALFDPGDDCISGWHLDDMLTSERRPSGVRGGVEKVRYSKACPRIWRVEHQGVALPGQKRLQARVAFFNHDEGLRLILIRRRHDEKHEANSKNTGYRSGFRNDLAWSHRSRHRKGETYAGQGDV